MLHVCNIQGHDAVERDEPVNRRDMGAAFLDRSGCCTAEGSGCVAFLVWLKLTLRVLVTIV